MGSFFGHIIARYVGLFMWAAVIAVVGIGINFVRTGRTPNEQDRFRGTCSTAVAWWNASVPKTDEITLLFDDVSYSGRRSARDSAAEALATIERIDKIQKTAVPPTIAAPVYQNLIELREGVIHYTEIAANGDDVDIDYLNEDLDGLYDAIETEQAKLKTYCDR